MECDKFESVMMDELYGELDELTSAAVKRHIATCGRCAALFGGLRATRRVAVLPVVEPPSDLENRILAAAYSTPVPVPLRRRAARVVSVAGTWAMRPQTAMAAVFLVMIGTSGLLLRGKSSRAPASSAMTVTEEGTPAPVASSVALAAGPTEPLPRAVAPSVVAPLARTGEGIGGGAAAPSSALASSNSSDLGADPGRARARARAAAKAGALGGSARSLGHPAAAADGRSTQGDDVFAQRPPSAAPAAEAVAAADAPAAAAAAPAGAPRGAAAASPVAASAAAATDSAFDDAMAAYRSRHFDEAAHAFDAISPGDVNADLWAARSLRSGRGCRAAVSRFDEVAARASGSRPGWDAALEGARCYRALGDVAGARARLLPLLDVAEFASRARAELAGLPGASSASHP